MSLFNLFHAATTLAELAHLARRRDQLIPLLRQRIEAEGGRILSVRSLNGRLIVFSPFPGRPLRTTGIANSPVQVQLRCQYPADSGSWFVQAPAAGPLLTLYAAIIAFTLYKLSHH